MNDKFEDVRLFFTKPLELSAWFTLLGVVVLTVLLPLSSTERLGAVLLALVGGLATYIRFHRAFMRQRFSDRAAVAGMFFNVVLIAAGVYFFDRHHVQVHLLFILPIVNAGVIAGRSVAWALAGEAVVADTLTRILLYGWMPSLALFEGFQLSVFLVAGLVTDSLSASIRQRNVQSYQSFRRQTERLAVLNEVARAIGSTIELNDLLELVYQQLSRVILTDTYYVSVYDPQEDAADMRILIDNGQRFPPRQIPTGAGLVGLVLRRRAPLLIRQLSRERDALELEPLTLGNPRSSESWLGVPLMVGDELLGVIAVASYQPNAFAADDVALLSTIAEQVAVALDNARHHAEVEEQARRDSLTGAYNHSHFITRLREEVASAKTSAAPISLIMLDIDYFKQYNDRYGHVVGDTVLSLTVQAIQAHVKKTDVVGRWGGEEFGVALVSATTEQAARVAERIRETMAQARLTDTNGQPIPAPTVSQGIATCPDHVADADALVIAADRALYHAKGAGRDQVRVAEGETQNAKRKT